MSSDSSHVTRCYADNYRCLSSFTLEFDPLSVLFGPNGSGKSTVIGLFARLRDFVLGRATSLEAFETLTRWDQRTEQTFEWTIRLQEGEFFYRLRITHKPEQALNKVVEETLTLDGKTLFESNDKRIKLFNDWHTGGVELLPDWHVSGISRIYERPDNKKLVAFRRAVESTIILAINPSLVSAISAEKQPVIIPRPDCSDFAGWLKHISSAEALARQDAEQKLAHGALPGFRAFQAVPSGDAQILQCIFQSGPKRLNFRLDELSAGQIALVILETAIAVATERRGALVLDEPGNFLALGEIQPLLARLQDAAMENQFQVILTAHHPVAVDFLATGFGFWLERDPSGPARPSRIHVSEKLGADTTKLRVSDLIARGWLSGLGLNSMQLTSERCPKPQAIESHLQNHPRLRGLEAIRLRPRIFGSGGRRCEKCRATNQPRSIRS